MIATVFRLGLRLVWTASVVASIGHLGILGLFLVAIADSSFVFVPFGNDLLLISLVVSTPTVGRAIACVCVATLGSLVGVALVDVVMRTVGEEGLEHFVRPRTIERLRRKLEGRVALYLAVASLAPPPFPFTAVVMTASALQTRRLVLYGAVLGGRLVRYAIEASLALLLGERLVRYLSSSVVDYAVWALVAVSIVGTAISLRKWLLGRRAWKRGRRELEPA